MNFKEFKPTEGLQHNNKAVGAVLAGAALSCSGFLGLHYSDEITTAVSRSVENAVPFKAHATSASGFSTETAPQTRPNAENMSPPDSGTAAADYAWEIGFEGITLLTVASTYFGLTYKRGRTPRQMSRQLILETEGILKREALRANFNEITMDFDDPDAVE
jgi:hypothetical protein